MALQRCVHAHTNSQSHREGRGTHPCGDARSIEVYLDRCEEYLLSMHWGKRAHPTVLSGGFHKREKKKMSTVQPRFIVQQ